MAPDLEFAASLRERGESASRLQRAVRSGELLRVRRGVYATPERWAALRDAGQHLALIEALEAERPGQTYSHWSAAAVHDLPVIGRWPQRPHVIVESSHGVSRRVLTVPHAVELRRHEHVTVGGIGVTSVVRTAMDVAAAAGAVTGAVILDAAAARAGRETIVAEIARRRPFRGVSRVDAAMRHVTGLAESPLESLSLVRFSELGFPPPAQQRWFDAFGEAFRVDFYWPEYDVIGEADGWGKYKGDIEAIKKEKRREDALRSQVRGFARWEWSDAWHAEGLQARLQAAGLPRDRGKSS